MRLMKNWAPVMALSAFATLPAIAADDLPPDEVFECLSAKILSVAELRKPERKDPLTSIADASYEAARYQEQISLYLRNGPAFAEIMLGDDEPSPFFEKLSGFVQRGDLSEEDYRALAALAETCELPAE